MNKPLEFPILFYGCRKNAIGIRYAIHDTIAVDPKTNPEWRLELLEGRTGSGHAYDHVQKLAGNHR
ncbi:hypothetical protein CMI37_31440 [Candidatus Pacearchaeota archaeon]|nr:hypothetical protein [Candidatus Pacearchaeota archaeon]